MTVLDAVNSEPKRTSSTQTDGKLPVVIDAGFDEFVRDHWDSLVAGEKKRFLSPAKKNAFCSRSPSATAWWSCVSNRPPAITRPKPTSASNWSCLTGLSACW
jgi:hypothetical protein